MVIKRMPNIIFAICLVMVFTAQAKAADNKKQQHAPAVRPAPVHNNQSRPQVQNRSTAPRQVANRPPTVRSSRSQPPQQARQQAPRVYAVPASPVVENNRPVHQPAANRRSTVRPPASQPSYQRNAEPGTIPTPAPVENNRLFHRQYHNYWQPEYNFYNNQYQFYPYVNVTSPVELSANCVTVLFNGQTYYYDRGTFYVQDPQGYLAIPPPIGIIVSTISSHATQGISNGGIYYQFKGVFYITVSQGYQVVGPLQ